MRIFRIAAALAVLFAVAIPRGATAQDRDENEVGKDDKSCEKAAKIVSKGHPEKKETWALGRLSICGKLGADALVTGMAQLVSDTDTLALESFFSTVDTWRDGAIMTAALNVASNPNASVQARVFSIRHLVILVRQRVKFRYGDISASPTAATTDEGTTLAPACGAAHGSELPNTAATPLPAKYAAVITAALANIDSTSSTPIPVRNAARCVR